MAPQDAPVWTVTSQREDFQPGPTGQLTQGIVVTFTTASGVSGSVFVPNADYHPDKVRGLVNARAQAMESISRLTSG